ncbi:OmpH family outer membrane protein [Erwinia sp. HR93]|uniref:OmpH family outer membrane protein n=1 Tax=Erwinia sp. HR93 TaxID=3094840 RepID=UPI002ADEC1B3|nr:OmpH family outer membrane protein [Erwinia sp. HR93]MEA1062952.1 OmpH family outer membrane protein [Erwinia sp. HR93]
MKLHNLLTAFFIFSLTAITAGCDNKGAQKSEVVYIDVAKAIIDSPLATQEKARLDQVRKILINAGDDAAKNYKGMDKNKAEQARVADTEVLNRQWVLEQRATRGIVLKKLESAINDLRQKKKYAIIINRNAVLSAADGSDVTDEVVTLLKDTKLNFGKLPEISVKAKAEN